MSRLIFSTLFASVLLMAVSIQVRADDAATAPPATQPAAAGTPATSSPFVFTPGKMGRHSSEDGLSFKALKTQLALSPDQITQLKPLFDAKKADLKTWDNDNAQKMADLKTNLDTAKDSGSKADIKAANAAIKTLKDDRAKIVMKDDTAVKAVLSAQQLKAWASYDLSQHELTMLTKASLTNTQKADVKTLADKYAPAAVTATDAKALDKVRRDFHKDVISTVLTDAQRAAMPSGKRSRKAAADSDSSGN